MSIAIKRLQKDPQVEVFRKLVKEGVMYRTTQHLARSRVKIDNSSRILMLGCNDYLALREDPRVIQAAQAAAWQYGTSTSGSRAMAANIPLHHELEETIAGVLNREACAVFPSGYHANVGVLSALFSKEDLVLSEKAVHASLVDGLRLAKTKTKIFDRFDTEKEIKETIQSNSNALGIILDSIYSMSGDVGPINLVTEELKNNPDPCIIVDEAHAFGIYGDGAGFVPELDGYNRVDLVTGTLSKAMASTGGFVSGSKDAIEAIRYKARAMIFSTGSTPSNLAAALSALKISQKETWRREKVVSLSDRLRARFKEAKIDTGLSTTVVVPAIIGDELKTGELAKFLFEKGIYAGLAIYPAVPLGQGMLRFSVTAALEESHIDYVANTLIEGIEKYERSAETQSPSGARG